MAKLGAKFDLARLIAKHNDEGDEFHFDLHTIIYTQWSCSVTSTELSTHTLCSILAVQFKANGNCRFSRTVALLFAQHIQKSPEVVKVLIIASNPNEELPVKSVEADNTTKWSSFAKRILKHAKVLVYYAHATGES